MLWMQGNSPPDHAAAAYAETAALYEYMDLLNGGMGECLTRDELREVVKAFGVQTTLV